MKIRKNGERKHVWRFSRLLLAYGILRLRSSRPSSGLPSLRMTGVLYFSALAKRNLSHPERPNCKPSLRCEGVEGCSKCALSTLRLGSHRTFASRLPCVNHQGGSRCVGSRKTGQALRVTVFLFVSNKNNLRHPERPSCELSLRCEGVEGCSKCVLSTLRIASLARDVGPQYDN